MKGTLLLLMTAAVIIALAVIAVVAWVELKHARRERAARRTR